MDKESVDAYMISRETQEASVGDLVRVTFGRYTGEAGLVIDTSIDRPRTLTLLARGNTTPWFLESNLTLTLS